jgi:4-nitrophenyl phosphatase
LSAYFESGEKLAMEIYSKRCFVFDLDGTVYMGDDPIQGTIDFIKQNLAKAGIFFMTNNTSKTPAAYLEKLAGFGINIGEDQIISPFIPLFRFIEENKLERIFVLANEKVMQYIKVQLPGVSFTDDITSCQAIVLTFDTSLTYGKLQKASLILQNNCGVRYVATHPDNVCPTNMGNIPDVGSFIKLLEMTTGRIPEKIFGKPNTDLLNSILEKYKKEDIVVVGDRLYTDKILADNAQIDFILVLSGEATRQEAEQLEKQPALIVDDLGIFKN